MNGIPIHGNVGLALTLLVLAGAILAVLRAIRRADKLNSEWLDLKTATISTQVHGLVTNQPLRVRLIRCVDEAVRSLEINCPWPARVREALNGIRIYIGGELTHVSFGRRLAGEFLPSLLTIVVGSDLAAICHEFAHVLEHKVGGGIDFNHERWPTNGLQKAEDDYLEWLRAGK